MKHLFFSSSVPFLSTVAALPNFHFYGCYGNNGIYDIVKQSKMCTKG
jgi:hypothetical protein